MSRALQDVENLPCQGGTGQGKVTDYERHNLLNCDKCCASDVFRYRF